MASMPFVLARCIFYFWFLSIYRWFGRLMTYSEYWQNLIAFAWELKEPNHGFQLLANASISLKLIIMKKIHTHFLTFPLLFVLNTCYVVCSTITFLIIAYQRRRCRLYLIFNGLGYGFNGLIYLFLLKEIFWIVTGLRDPYCGRLNRNLKVSNYI